MENKLEITQRKSVSDSLRKYDYLAKENSFIEVTEWTNGEGYDITIDEKMISLTDGQLDAIYYLVETLMFQNK
jgi:hypothetical protein|nr:MAG TPA: glycoside hydrolase family protein [Crassvirales sp.]